MPTAILEPVRTDRPNLDSYVIRGGSEGVARLSVLAAAMQPSTLALLDGLGSLAGRSIVDAACGAGDVALELARRAGPAGRMHGLDLDAVKLAAARERAQAQGLANCSFSQADVTAPWLVTDAQLVYARFILTHLREPERMLACARNALAPGARIVIEDIDAEGAFFHPHCDAVATFRCLYLTVTRLKGCDPCIGRRLHELVEDAGLSVERTGLVQPYGSGDHPAKRVVAMTFEAIGDSLLAAKLVSRPELERMLAEVASFIVRPDSILSMPRVFQVVAVKK